MTSDHDENQHTVAAHHAIEQAARDSYSRLLAFLSVRSSDVASAEEQDEREQQRALPQRYQQRNSRNPARIARQQQQDASGGR